MGISYRMNLRMAHSLTLEHLMSWIKSGKLLDTGKAIHFGMCNEVGGHLK